MTGTLLPVKKLVRTPVSKSPSGLVWLLLTEVHYPSKCNWACELSLQIFVLSHERQNTTGILIWAPEEKHRHNSASSHPGIDWVKKVLLHITGVCFVEGLFSSVSCSWISSVLGQLTNSCKNNNHWSEGKQDGNAVDFHRTSCFLAIELSRELWES